MEREQQPCQGRKRDGALPELGQAVHDAGGPVSGLLLGPVQGVIVFGVFVIRKVYRYRFAVDDIRHMIGDHLGLGLFDDLREGAATRGE